MRMQTITEPTNINLYFGQRNQVTLEKFSLITYQKNSDDPEQGLWIF